MDMTAYTAVAAKLHTAGRLRTDAKAKMEAALTAFAAAESDLDVTQKAALVITSVAEGLQVVLQASVSALVKQALTGVFGDDAYDFIMRFVPRAGKMDVEFVYATKDGQELSPLEDSGVGTVDVSSFALRVSLLNVAGDTVRPVLLLDEPFKNVSTAYRKTFLDLVRQLSHEMNVQFVIVTHHEDVISIADNVISVSKRSRKTPSEVTCEVQ